MTSKCCSICNVQKDLAEFYSRTRKNGTVSFDNKCKVCAKLKTRNWIKSNKERKKENDKKYREENKERKQENDKKYREENKERKQENDKKYRDQNKEKIKQYKKEHYEEHKIKYRETKRKWGNKKRQTDDQFRMLSNLRNRVRDALRSTKKSDRTINLLGCTIIFFMNWLEHQFDSTMSWETYGKKGGWQVDHVIPCAYFDFTNEDEQLKCFNWKNCRPLEAKKNNQKIDKILPFDILMQELKVYHYTRQTSLASVDNKQHIQIAGNSLAS